jgi:hypothetical protein
MDISGSLGINKPSDESSVIDDIIISIINILNFLIIGLVTVGESVGFPL